MNKLILIIALFCPPILKAQQTTPVRQCVSNDILNRQLAEDPMLNDRIEAIERRANEFVRTQTLKTRTEQVTIPVVIHIVYRTEAENISEAQVRSQMDVLNRDYNKKSAEIGNTPSAFQTLVADCGIRFELAQIDPQGRPTTGIVRYATQRTTWGQSDDVKRPANGGVAPWDATKYLNIYVCNIGSNLLGYASFPGTPLELDGVVIDYTAFGTTGTARAPFHLGRTAVHEIGHWLNLFHIWGDSDCGDDHVADTPTHQKANYGKVTSARYSTCNGSRTQDMTMNFMDYVNDESMWMFTNGQKARMMSVLSNGGVRYSVTQSNAHINPNGNSNNDNATTQKCGTVKGATVVETSENTALITWVGVDDVKEYIVEFKAKNETKWTSVNAANTHLNFTNLKSNTNYEFRIKANCQQAEFTATQSFATKRAIAKLSDVKTYPNPVVNEMTIEFETKMNDQITIEIVDMNGQVKLTKVVNSANNVTLDLSDLTSGVYFLTAKRDYEQIVKKIVKTSEGF